MRVQPIASCCSTGCLLLAAVMAAVVLLPPGTADELPSSSSTDTAQLTDHSSDTLHSDTDKLHEKTLSTMMSGRDDTVAEIVPVNFSAHRNASATSVMNSKNDDDVPPTIPFPGEFAETSSLSMSLHQIDVIAPDPQPGFTQTEIVIVAVGVGILSMILVIASIIATFLIRRRMRRKAYLRVKHASQTELAVHFIQNTPASVAARDAAMEQLFQSLASMNAADGQSDFQTAGSGDDHSLSPTDSNAVEIFGGKDRAYSRSMPSLKNLNAHEEALNCTPVVVNYDLPGKMKGRSRSFTEKAVHRVDATPAMGGRNKSAVRSHSEKKNRLTVALLNSKRFEKKSNKSNRRSAPSFSRLAKFNLLKSLPTKQKSASTQEETPLPRVASHSDAAHFIAPDNLVPSQRCSNSLSDFELPTVSPILQDFNPMLTSLQIKTGSLGNCKCPDSDPETGNSQDSENRSNAEELENRSPNGKKLQSLEEVRDEYLHGKSRHQRPTEIRTGGMMQKDLSSPPISGIDISCKSRSASNLDKQKPTIA